MCVPEQLPNTHAIKQSNEVSDLRSIFPDDPFPASSNAQTDHVSCWNSIIMFRKGQTDQLCTAKPEGAHGCGFSWLWYVGGHITLICCQANNSQHDLEVTMSEVCYLLSGALRKCFVWEELMMLNVKSYRRHLSLLKRNIKMVVR